MPTGISGKIINVRSKDLPDGTLVTASEKLTVDGREIKDKIYIVKKKK